MTAMSDVSLILLTLQVAAVATVVNIPVALAISWLIVKRRVRGRFIIDVAVSLPLAVPPVVIGYALLLVLGREGPIGVLLRRAFGVELVFTWVAAALAAAFDQPGPVGDRHAAGAAEFSGRDCLV